MTHMHKQNYPDFTSVTLQILKFVKPNLWKVGGQFQQITDQIYRNALDMICSATLYVKTIIYFRTFP